MRVLNYHGVVDRSTETTHLSYLFADVRDFEAQVLHLRRVACPVSLAEIESCLLRRDKLPDDAVHISFDDGYRNNLVVAEILGRHRLPWSLFVISDAVLDGYRPWFLRLADAIRITPSVTLQDGSVFEMTSQKDKRRFAKLAKAEVMAVPNADQDGAVDEILALPGMRSATETSWPLLDGGEVRELHTAGVEIGNHSARHRNLLRCSDSDLHEEVAGSQARLEQLLGSSVRYFAYPDGRHDRRLRRTVGVDHSLALATWTVRMWTARLALRRYEPLDDADLGAILESPEPWYGRRWAGWTLPWRAREVALRARPSRRKILPPEKSAR